MASHLLQMLSAADENEDILLLELLCKQQEVFERNFDLELLSDVECKSLFRFNKDDIIRLRDALQIPLKYVCNNRTVVNGTEGLCILLRRLAYPNRLEDLLSVFGKSKFELSHVFNTVLDDLYERYNHLLNDLNRSWLSHYELKKMANSIRNRGSPLDKCWGFIDGTVRPICRPISDQRLTFNGHKRTHALKFQCISTPNGIIANMFGPVEGCRHDAGMLRQSEIQTQLEDYMTLPNGDIYSLYGDPAYPSSAYILTPYKSAVLSVEEREFNKQMSAVRTSVEWMLGKIINLFPFLDFKKNLKLHLQPVGKYYQVGSLLTNCHTCLYGCECATYFDLNPPTLESYLRG